jgi:hypothetical protein
VAGESGSGRRILLRQVFSFAVFLGELLVAATFLASPKIPLAILSYTPRGRARNVLASLAGMK